MDFTKLVQKLGFSFPDGICHGFSMRAIEASILQENDLFKKRMALIFSYKNNLDALINKINDIKKKKTKSDDVDKVYLDILSFFDSLALYHGPQVFGEILGNQVKQDDITHIANYAASDKIKERGGLVNAFSDMMISTKSEVTRYLHDLEQIIRASTPAIQGPVTFLLGNNGHAMALIYEPGKGWRLTDINPYSPKTDKIISHKTAAHKIFGGFERCRSSYRAFHLSLITTPQNLNPDFINQLNKFKNDRVLTKEIAQRAEEFNLAHIALRYNNIPLLRRLAQLGTNLEFTHPKYGNLAQQATLKGYADALQILAENRADLNVKDPDGNSLAHLAVSINKDAATAIIQLLVDHGINLQVSNDEGFTPATFAVSKGYAEGFEALANCGVNLNEQDREGDSPVHTAARQGNLQIIELLHKHQVYMGSPNAKGHSPDMLAAGFGHANIIKFFAENNIYISNYAIFDAAQRGQVQVFNELIAHKIDICDGVYTTIEKLCDRLNPKDLEVKARLEAWLNTKRRQNEIFSGRLNVNAYDIAFILNHQSTLDLISPHFPEEKQRYSGLDFKIDYCKQYNTLLLHSLKTEATRLKTKAQHNNRYRDVSEAASELCEKITGLSEDFFNNIDPQQITAEEIQRYEEKYKAIIDESKPAFVNETGAWSKIHLILKALLGIVATLLVIPALIINATSKYGYVATFFKAPVMDVQPPDLHYGFEPITKVR